MLKILAIAVKRRFTHHHRVSAVFAFLLECAGWLGAGVLLLAYGLVSSARLRAGGPAYQLMNLGGSVGLALSAGVHNAWPSATVNVLWMGIAVVALGRQRS
jgi:hypothetical protein